MSRISKDSTQRKSSVVVSLVAAAALIAVILLVSPTYRSAIAPIHISGISHGMRLSLSVPRSTYPKGALILATVRVTNVSQRLITSPGISCTQSNPEVEDLDRTGKILYPNGMSGST